MLSEDLRDEEKRAAALVVNGGSPEAVEVARDSMKLQAEVRRLERILRRQAEPVFGSMRSTPDGAIETPVEDPAGLMRVVFASLVQILALGNAPNYVQIGGYHPEVGRIEIIVQRVGKLSPHEARDEAERHLGRAVKLLQEHGIAWEGPTSFRPDEPPSRDVPVDSERSWIVIDTNVQPNDLLCQRCGTRQVMPAKGTAAVLNAFMEAFAEQHAACEDGDASAGKAT